MNILSKKAVLVVLSVGGWNARRYDERAADVIHDHFHASRDAGKYTKHLIDTRDPVWTAITKARSELRDYHYAHTLPWVHKGAHLLPTAKYLDYNSEIARLRQAYLDAAEEFLASYERLKAHARKTRNGLYREEDYPTKAELRRKFYAEVSYMPVPDSGHVVVDLTNAEVERIKRDTEAMVEQAVAQAQAEVWARLMEPVRHMAEALADPERRFHDSLVENVRAIVKLAPSLNLTGDRKLDEMIAEVKKHLTKASPDTLRNDPDKRAENAKKAAELAAKMAALMPTRP
jgi:hypothetical protein